MRHWRSLDGLRALAVLIVFAGHVRGTPLPGGFIGVDVFFVLSGFLITGLLLREQSTHGSISLRAFFARRVLRLYPALLLLCAVALPMAAVSKHFDVRSTTLGLASALVYCFNLAGLARDTPLMVGNLWSLSVEEQYYLLWAPLAALMFARLGTGRRTGQALAGLVLAGWATLALTALWFGRAGIGAAYFQLHGHLVELLIGGLLAWLVASGVPHPIARVLGHPAAPALAFGGLLLAALRVGRVDGTGMVVLYPALALASAVVIGHLVVAQGWAVRLLALPPLRWLGLRSYAFYLFHRPVLHLVEEHLSSRTAVVLVALPTSLALAELSWRLVERRALDYKDRFSRVEVPVAT